MDTDTQQINPRTGLVFAALGAVVCFAVAGLLYVFVLGKEPMVQVDMEALSENPAEEGMVQ